MVDDDEAVRESLVAVLFASGFESETFNSAEDYLALAPSNGDCLLLDVNMPGMSGLDLLQCLSEQGQRTATIILTANPDDRLRERAHQFGVIAFLTKPVAGSDLLEAITAATKGE
ncbi:MAG: response regulator [Paracoccaceae bacterium]|nr:response regulator [Paracoccaceae bacterium]